MKLRATLLVAGAVVLFAAAQAAVGGKAAEKDRSDSGRLSAARARIVAPPRLVKQVYRNNCETAALSMMLSAVGIQVDQRVLQRRVRRSGPLDPIVEGDGSWTWGDPDKGFVGRPEGGGVAGGFGVYHWPIRRLALRYGVGLRDLTRRDLSTVLESLRQRRPVLAWIGLSEGPYRRWRTPAGRQISVNLGEHTVVLVGMRGSTILVNDPLTGRRLEWSVAEFDRKWQLLGRRALGL